jgi:hypothetical protein
MKDLKRGVRIAQKKVYRHHARDNGSRQVKGFPYLRTKPIVPPKHPRNCNCRWCESWLRHENYQQSDLELEREVEDEMELAEEENERQSWDWERRWFDDES